MLEMRPNCECCNKDLPPESGEAFICSFECTFCADCVAGVLSGRCPNCAGPFSQRPTRPSHLMPKYPPSTKRVVKENGCAASG